MKPYVLIPHICVQNANAIAGLTYGFPAITNFLGFAHALSRKLPSEFGLTLGGVAVACHSHDIHARQPKGWGDYVFALSRNPLTKKGETAPINEEGRMNMEVSLFIELEGHIVGDEQTEQALLETLDACIPAMRLAGGQITRVNKPQLLSSDKQQMVALRKLMPASVLRDQNDYLQTHFEKLKAQDDKADVFDAWIDFAALKYRAKRITNESDSATEREQSKAEWHYIPKPEAGYLVPIASGFCAISETYAAGDVSNVRDKTVPVTFAETAYSIGEWQSVHRLKTIHEAVWRYEYQYPWYLAKSEPFEIEIPEPEFNDNFDPDFL